MPRTVRGKWGMCWLYLVSIEFKPEYVSSQEKYGQLPTRSLVAWSLVACTRFFRLAICHFIFEPAFTPLWCSTVPCITYAVFSFPAKVFARTMVITFKRNASLNIIPLTIIICFNTVCVEARWSSVWYWCGSSRSCCRCSEFEFAFNISDIRDWPWLTFELPGACFFQC